MTMLRGFLPVTTFEYPLDHLIRPFLPRFSRTLMISYHFARQATGVLPLPAFIDSGGFAALLPGSEVVERPDGTGMIVTGGDEMGDPVTPEAVLALQRRLAAYACPLDFPIPPSMHDEAERARRLRLTLANARWLQARDSGSLVLYGAVQGWDEASYIACARELVAMGYQHLALGGMVPRLSDMDFVERLVREVRSVMLPSGGLHVFGVGKPDLIARVVAAGATSTDSSSYVKAAASGTRWDGVVLPDDPTPFERAHAALANVRLCAQAGISG